MRIRVLSLPVFEENMPVPVSSSLVELQFRSAERDKKRLDRFIIYWICVFILCIF